jgi:hypothetical protein
MCFMLVVFTYNTYFKSYFDLVKLKTICFTNSLFIRHRTLLQSQIKNFFALFETLVCCLYTSSGPEYTSEWWTNMLYRYPLYWVSAKRPRYKEICKKNIRLYQQKLWNIHKQSHVTKGRVKRPLLLRDRGGGRASKNS